MPDLAVPPPNALYPQPPQQQGALSADPSKMLDLIGTLMRNEQMRRDLAGRAAVGQAYQGALNPDGTVDPNRLRAGLSNPDASWMLPETVSRSLSQQSAQFDLLAKQSDWLTGRLGALANKRNLSMEDVNSFVVDAARDAGVNPAVLVGFQNRVATHPGGVREAVKAAAAQAIGSAGLAGRVTGPPDVSGAPTTMSVGQTVYGTQPGQPMPVGQAPGEQEVQTASAGRASVLQATAATTNQTHTDLANLRDLSRAFGIGGPTAELEIRLGQIGQRLGLPTTLTSRQLAAGEEFNKIANFLSVNQTKSFYGSDAALHAVVGSNPNLSTSTLGREGVIDMLHGNQDAIDTMRKEWLKQRAKGAPANSFDTWVSGAGQVIDPRLFQFNRLSRQGQQTFYDQLDPLDRGEFERRYKDAVKRGWVKRAKPPPAPGE